MDGRARLKIAIITTLSVMAKENDTGYLKNAL
jgi:hypothetical protein